MADPVVDIRRVVIVSSEEIAARGAELFPGATVVYQNGELTIDPAAFNDAVVADTDRARIEQFCAAFAAVQCAKVRFWEQDLSELTTRQQVLDAAGGIKTYVQNATLESGESATTSRPPPRPESGSGAAPVENLTQREREAGAPDEKADAPSPRPPDPTSTAQEPPEPPQDDAPPGWHDDVPDEAETVLRSIRTASEAKKHSHAQAQSQTPGEWPDPADFWGATALPELLAEYLPPAIAPYVLDQASRVGVDPTQVALNCYTICSALLRTGIELRMQADSGAGRVWVEKPVLWGAVVGMPSTKKGPALDVATHKFNRIAMELRAKNEAAWERHYVAEKIHEKRMQSYYSEAAKNPQAIMPEAPEKPPRERLWTDDTTLQVLAKLITENPRGKIAIVKDELAGWFGSFDAFTAGKADIDRPAYLSFYESKERYVDRVAEGRSYHVKSFGGTILGGIQPDILARVAAKLGTDGMLQRFQIVIAAPARQVEPRRPDQSAIDQWERVQEGLAAMVGAGTPITLSIEAAAYMAEQVKWIGQAIGVMESPALQAVLGKWEGLYGRLMIVSQCIADAAEGRTMPSQQIGESVARQAWAWMRWILWPHAIRFYTGILEQGEEAGIAKSFAEFVLARGIESIRPHILASSWTTYRRTLKTIQARREFWSRVEQVGWVRPCGVLDRAIQISTEYEINPLAFDGRFAGPIAAAKSQVERYRQAMHPAMLAKQGREPGED